MVGGCLFVETSEPLLLSSWESDICNKRMWINPAWGIFISFKIYTKQVDTWLHIATYPFYCIVARISLYIKYLNTTYSIHLWTYNGYAMICRNYIECCFDINDNISEKYTCYIIHIIIALFVQWHLRHVLKNNVPYVSK